MRIALVLLAALAMLTAPAIASRQLLAGPAQAPGSTPQSPPPSPVPTLPAVTPPTPVSTPPAAAPPSPLVTPVCSCTATSDKSGDELCFVLSGDTTTVDCTIPAGLSCVAVRAQDGQIAPKAGPVFSCTQNSVVPPSQPPIVPPKPPTPAPGPPIKSNCLCTPSPLGGSSYCFQRIGSTTSTDCNIPAGEDCTIVQAGANQFAPVAGPVWQCSSHNAPPTPSAPAPSAPAPSDNRSPPPPITPVTPLIPITPVTPLTPNTPGGNGAVTLTGTDVLNFLLNLEYLEAEFFSYAATGKGLDDKLADYGPASSGGQLAQLSTDLQATAQEFASIESSIISDLQGLIGPDAAARPALNIGSAFSDAANMALQSTLTPSFNPYNDSLSFLEAAFLLADTQASAWTSALTMIQDDTTRTALTGVLATKGYQAGLIRQQVIANKDAPTAFNQTVEQIANSFATLNELNSQGATFNLLLSKPGSTVQPIPADSNGSIVAITLQQALDVFTLSTASNSQPGMGGFFPDGFSGISAPQMAVMG